MRAARHVWQAAARGKGELRGRRGWQAAQRQKQRLKKLRKEARQEKRRRKAQEKFFEAVKDVSAVPTKEDYAEAEKNEQSEGGVTNPKQIAEYRAEREIEDLLDAVAKHEEDGAVDTGTLCAVADKLAGGVPGMPVWKVLLVLGELLREKDETTHWTTYLKKQFRYKKVVGLKNDPGNITLLLRHLPVFKCVHWDLLNRRVNFGEGKSLPQIGELERPSGDMHDKHVPYLSLILRQQCGVSYPGLDVMLQAAAAATEARTVNRAKDYMTNALRCWDGVPRAAKLCEKLGLEDIPLYEKLVMKTLISGVAKAHNPTELVRAMFIIIGDQGAGKSKGVKALAPPGMHRELVLPKASSSAKLTKERGELLAGVLVAEMVEMSGSSRSRAAQLAEKGWLSATEDVYCEKYERLGGAKPRMTIFIGTSNDHEFLRDPTGSDRYWPARCVRPVDVDWLEKHRQQFWGEATFRYHRGEKWWLEDDADKEALKELHKDHQEVSAEEEGIEVLVERMGNVVFVKDVLNLMGVEDVRDQGHRATREVTDTLRRLGYQQKRPKVPIYKDKKHDGYTRPRCWLKPGASVEDNDVKRSLIDRYGDNSVPLDDVTLMPLNPEEAQKRAAEVVELHQHQQQRVKGRE